MGQPEASPSAATASVLEQRMADRQNQQQSSSKLSSQEALEEQQRLQAALLQVALRAYPTDVSRLAKSGLAVPWANGKPPTMTPHAPAAEPAKQRIRTRQESLACSTDTSLPSSFLATLRGLTPPLTPRRPVQAEPSSALSGETASRALSR